MKRLDGKYLASQILEETKKLLGKKQLSLGVISVAKNEVSRRFVDQKVKRGEEIGVLVKVYDCSKHETTRSLRKRAGELVRSAGHDGFIVQLPLPSQINAQYILNAIPEIKDADLLSQKSIGAFLVGRSKILPPVVGAIETLLRSAGVDLWGKRIVIVGEGQLVGKPMALRLLSQNIPFSILNETSVDFREELKRADIIISGVGRGPIITKDMVRDGVALIDAGNTLANGVAVGDVDPSGLEDKDGWLASVPGGVGPLTVAYIFRNLMLLNS